MEGSTLFTIFKLLNDNKYKREAVKKLEGGDLEGNRLTYGEPGTTFFETSFEK